jgi:hypothetical protein
MWSLGTENDVLRRRVKTLRSVFVEPNHISHGLDLKKTKKPGDRSRRTRTIDGSKQQMHEVLEVGQLILNEVASSLAAAEV